MPPVEAVEFGQFHPPHGGQSDILKKSSARGVYFSSSVTTREAAGFAPSRRKTIRHRLKIRNPADRINSFVRANHYQRQISAKAQGPPTG